MKMNGDDNQFLTTVVLRGSHREAKRQELLKTGLTELMIHDILEEGIELELYYHKGCGAFMVEPEAVDTDKVVCPYCREPIVNDYISE